MFYRFAVEELLKEDGLCVFAPGLGLKYFLTKFVQLYCNQDNLVFVLNATNEFESVTEGLEDEGVTKNLPLLLNSDVNATQRQLCYADGGCYFITNRVLVVDFLTKRLDPKHVSGFLIYQGHKASKTSIMGLILHIYRQNNQIGFIKAFSESLTSMVSGFNKCEKVLKALMVPKAYVRAHTRLPKFPLEHSSSVLYIHRYFWPRFHLSVKDWFRSVKPEPRTMEMYLPPSRLMKEIERAIMECMSNCLKELCKSNKVLAGEDVSVAQALSLSFDNRISRILAGVSGMKTSTRQLMNDIRTLRTLSQQLLKVDAVSFYRILRGIQRAATPRFGRRRQPMWLLADAADRLFKCAKHRVYEAPKNSFGKKIVRLVLEPNPKWRLLKQALAEIRKEEYGSSSDDSHGRTIIVLVIVDDDATAKQLRHILGPSGESSLLRRELRRFVRREFPRTVQFKTESVGYQLRQLIKQFETESLDSWIELARNEKLEKAFPNWEENVRFVWESSAEENAKALEALRRSHVRLTLNDVKGGEDELASRDRAYRFFSELLEYCSVRDVRNIVKEKQEVEISTKDEDEDEDDGAVDPEEAWLFMASQSTTLPHESEFESSKKSSNSVSIRILIQPTRGRSDLGQILRETQASHVVLYDPNVRLVREIEVYNAFRIHEVTKSVRVYFLMYEDSTEEQRYLNTVKSEMKAFKQLIQEMSHIVIPNSELYPLSTSQALKEKELTISQTRIGGRGKKKIHVPSVIVDLREFRSALPAILHNEGIQLQPVTLEVGDYVLSRDVCVERKSIPDLIGSLQSGRLYTQAESMARHYDLSTLLIEFDPERAFILRSNDDMSSTVNADSTTSKLVLLTRHFPKLRLLWSRSPHMTSKIFTMLKHNREEPDIQKASSLKQNEETIGNPEGEQIDHSARNFLLRLPGVKTAANARVLQRNIRNLSELSNMSVNDLQPLIGMEGARKLVAFLNKSL